MQRTTRSQLDHQITRLNQLLGLPVEPWGMRPDGKGSQANIGNIHLDHNIGGYAIHQMGNDGGGVRTPFGDYRMTAGECWTVLRAACGAVTLALERASLLSEQP